MMPANCTTLPYHQDLRLFQQRARQAHELSLSDTKVLALLRDNHVQLALIASHDFLQLRAFQHLQHATTTMTTQREQKPRKDGR